MQAAEKEKLESRLGKWTTAHLNSLLDLLDVSRGSGEEALKVRMHVVFALENLLNVVERGVFNLFVRPPCLVFVAEGLAIVQQTDECAIPAKCRTRKLSG